MNKLDLSSVTESRQEVIRALLSVISKHRDSIEDLTGVLESVMWRELIEAESVAPED